MGRVHDGSLHYNRTVMNKINNQINIILCMNKYIPLMGIMALFFVSMPLAYAQEQSPSDFMTWLIDTTTIIENSLFDVESNVDELEDRLDGLEDSLNSLQIISNFTNLGNLTAIQLSVTEIQTMSLGLHNRTSDMIVHVDELQDLVDNISNSTQN